MKKLTSVLVMLLFMFSIIGMVYAERGSDDNGSDDSDDDIVVTASADVSLGTGSDDSDDDDESDDSGNDSESDANDDRITGIDDSDDDDSESDDSSSDGRRMLEQLREERKQKFEAAKEALKERREIAIESKVRFKADLEERKAAYEDAKEEYKSKKEELRQLQGEIKSCRDSDSDDCRKVKEQSIEDARAMLISAVVTTEGRVNEIKVNIEANEYLDANTVERLLNNLDEVLVKLSDIKVKMENATTGVELRAAAKEYNTLLKEIDASIKISYYRHAKASVHSILVRAEVLEGRLQMFIDKLAGNGTNTTSVQVKIDEFSSLIASAKADANSADAKFVAAQSLKIEYGSDMTDEEKAEIKLLIDEGKDLLDTAKDEIKDAYDLLKEIIKDLRVLNKGPVVLEASVDATVTA